MATFNLNISMIKTLFVFIGFLISMNDLFKSCNLLNITILPFIFLLQENFFHHLCSSLLFLKLQKGEPSYILVGMQIVIVTLENSKESPQKVKNRTIP